MKIGIAYDHRGFETWEREWVHFLLGSFEIREYFDPTFDMVDDTSVFITLLMGDGLEERARAFRLQQRLRAIRAQGRAAVVFHLSDEWMTAPRTFYTDAKTVFRNHRLPRSTNNVHFFALGYKAGLPERVSKARGPDERCFLWSFAGQMKRSRERMLSEAHRLPRGRAVITHHWDDPAGLSLDDYAALLNESVFVLCPSGNWSFDTFRIYEALEAGAIPIVEDGPPPGPDRRRRLSVLNMTGRNLRRRIFPGNSYWLSSYGDDFPCPRIRDWRDLTTLIRATDPDTMARKCCAWWGEYKLGLQQAVTAAVQEALWVQQ